MKVFFNIITVLVMLGALIGIDINQSVADSSTEKEQQQKIEELENKVQQYEKQELERKRRIEEQEKNALRQQIADLEKQNGILESTINDKDTSINQLKKRLAELQPKILPKLNLKDINNQLTLNRIYSVEAGHCFDAEGNSSCFFATIKEQDKLTGYLLYKTSGSFSQSLTGYSLFDHKGNNLTLLTQSSRQVIETWEKQNPNHSLRMSFH